MHIYVRVCVSVQRLQFQVHPFLRNGYENKALAYIFSFALSLPLYTYTHKHTDK